MHIKTFLIILLASIVNHVHCQVVDDGQMLELIDDFVEQAMECANIPGLTLSVVKDNADFIAKGYGVRNITELEPVTNETLFLLASVTKAFTGITAAILLRNEEAGENRLNWRTSIREFLQMTGEDFYFNETVQSQLVNLRDLFGHRTGLSFNNPIRIYGYDIDEAMHRLQYLPIVNDFRDDYVFNNLMFGLAGWIIEKADGRTWEQFTWDELLQPIGMTSSTFMKNESKWNEFATGHYIDENTDEPRSVSLEITKAYFEAFSAAGSIGSNAKDMLQWIKFQLNEGATEDGVEILSPVQFEVTHSPSMQKRVPPRWEKPYDPVTYKFGTHSVAWSEHTYRDYRISQHIGGETGFQSLITVGRSMGFGIFTGINKDPNQGAMDFIHMYIMDLLLGVEPWLNTTDICDMMTDPLESGTSCDVCQYNYDIIPKMKSNMGTKSKSSKPKHSSSYTDVSDLPELYDSGTMTYNNRFRNGIHINALNLTSLTGCYGHFAYGNISIGLSDTSNQLFMVYGLKGKYEWTWDLEVLDEDNLEFQGTGRDLIWYYKVLVVFETTIVEETETEEAIHLYVDFDRELPPRFDRDLDWNNPPPPPPLCNQ